MHNISFSTSVDQNFYNSGANSLCIWGIFELTTKMIEISNAAIKKESYSHSKTNKMYQFLRFILFWNNTLPVSVFPSIIRRSRLYVQQQVYVKQILLTAC